MALENFDLRGYDLVVSSESGPAKGVITSATPSTSATPLRRCATCGTCIPPIRNEWTKSRLQRAADGAGGELPASLGLRFRRARRPLHRQSHNVQRRIWKTYRRESDVIHPPSTWTRSTPSPPKTTSSRSASSWRYKRIDSIVQWASRTGRRLRIAGAGPEYANLRAMAGKSVEFLGRVSDNDLRELYARCRAFLPARRRGLRNDARGGPGQRQARGRASAAAERWRRFRNSEGVFYAEPTEVDIASAIGSAGRRWSRNSSRRVTGTARQFGHGRVHAAHGSGDRFAATASGGPRRRSAVLRATR